MRVLHVLNTGKYSGAENVVITLIHALKDQVEFAYTSPDGPIRDILKENGIQFYPVSTPATNTKELKRIIGEFKPEIIHTHDYKAGIMVVLTGTNVPIISHLHNNTPWLRKICPRSVAYYLSCYKYRVILTVSESVMKDFIFGDCLNEKSRVVGNPIDLSAIRRKANESGILDTPSDIMFLGRLSLPKNPIFFLEIIRDLVKIKPDISVAMVGSGEIQAEVEKKVTELGLERSVTLYGFQKNPYGLLKSSKVMCMPSLWEGFGLAAVEGLAFGKPVVAAPVGGLKGIVTDECGLLCDSKESFEKEITRLLADKEYYEKKSDGAFQRASELDNIQYYAERIYDEYCRVTRSE